MKTVDLRRQTVTLQELLRMAKTNPVLILADDDHRYTLEEAGDFEREVAMLGKSDRFSKFLAERGKEPGEISLERIEESLEADENA